MANSKNNKTETFENIVIEESCKMFSIELSDFYSKSRKREFVYARHFASKFIKDMALMYGKYYSLEAIGAATGGRDHASAMHSIREASNLISTDKGLLFRYCNTEIDIKVRLNHVYRITNTASHIRKKRNIEFPLLRQRRIRSKVYGRLAA